jgi:hypothetical protein
MRESIFATHFARRAITRVSQTSLVAISSFLHFLVLGLCCLPMTAMGGEQAGYTIQGRLRHEAFLADGTNRTWVRDFKITKEECIWAIESTDPATGAYTLSAQVDGLMHSVTKVNAGKSPALNDYHEVIEQDPVPPSGDLSASSVLWLAFASERYLKSVTNSQYEPIWMLDDPSLRRENFTISGLLDTFEGGLPQSLFYLNRGAMYAISGGRRVVVHAAPSFQVAVTNASYQAITSTNFGNVRLPLTFEFQRFAISPPEFSTRLLTRITGNVTRVQPAAQSVIEAASVKGIVWVNDLRFAKSEPDLPSLNYRLTNSIFVPSTNSILLEAKYVAILNQIALARQSGAKSGK